MEGQENNVNRTMMGSISKEDVLDKLSELMHPEIDNDLVELGMIGDVKVRYPVVSLTLMLPFQKIPIKYDLMDMIKESLYDLDGHIDINIKTDTMSEAEKENFLKLAREGWKF